MVFLDPKSDIVFKRLFGDSAHQNIVISFLNSVLDRKGSQVIVSVEMNDPNNIPAINENKSSIVDVRCTDQAGKEYIVEMQVIAQSYYGMRAQYYASQALSNQLKTRTKYDTLVPVIFIGVLYFDLFDHENYLSHHLILDTKTYKQELNLLEFHFIELKKFHKTIEELTTLVDRWIYFLSKASTLQSIPENFEIPEFEAAFHVLERSGWKQADYDRYERSLDYIRSDAGRFEAGKEEGIAIGKEEGIAIGKEEGIAIGKEEEKKNIALAMLNYLDINAVAQITQLNVDEIKKLKEKK